MDQTKRYNFFPILLLVALLFLFVPVSAIAAQENETTKPNIVIIWGDDIGQTNVSAYSMGVM
jgi:hypothetical protein